MLYNIEFLHFLHYLHYIILFLYILTHIGIRYFQRKKREKYIESIDVFFKICVALLLISLYFKEIHKINKKNLKLISKLMLPAGTIILSSLRTKEIHKFMDTIDITFRK